MPWASSDLNASYYAPNAIGPVMQCVPNLPAAVPATIAASGSYDSGVIIADGYRAIAAGVTLDQAGSLEITRYLDPAGTVPLAAADTTTLTASTGGVVVITDGKPFASFRVVIKNTGAAVANVSGFALLLNAE